MNIDVIIQRVKGFTSYSIYFDDAAKYDTLTCDKDDDLNRTYIEISNAINRCVEPKYKPRILSTQQVSWKRNKVEDESNATISSGGPPKKNIVHKYLVFALLLPKHPYSFDTYNVLQTIAPMFPAVTVVAGNGYEFHELGSQYGVRSFPKILFFKNGILTSKFRKERTPELLSTYIAKWTRSLPNAIPLKTKVSATPDFQQFVPLILPHNFSNFNITLPKIFVPNPGPSVEPFVGCFQSLVDYDLIIFLVAGLYVLSRCIWLFYRTYVLGKSFFS